jgi:serine/threonine protein kinase
LDIKPSNVFVDAAAEHAKVSDFGISRVATTAHHALLLVPTGTPAYMAPEQKQPGTKVSRATDLYQLAATLWDLLVGKPPGIVRSVPDGLQPDRRRLLEFLDQAMGQDQSTRPGDAAQFGSALAHVLA